MGKIGTALQIGRTFGMRDGMLRLEYEFQRGSGLMSRRLRSVQGWRSWDLGRIAPHARAENLLAARRRGDPAFFFSDSQTLGSAIRKAVGVAKEELILAEAGSVLGGKLPFFGQLSLDCRFPPQWFRNPVTGQRVSPRQPWTKMRFAAASYGDLKFILEPSRFLFVYPLARAYAVSGDERYPQAFWNAIEDWARSSPPMTGPLWICGQECSLRILAWSFALYAFLNSPATTPDRTALLVSMIAAHAWRTAQTLGYARSQRSNHLISEAVGLWTAGTLYPELSEASVWRNVGARLLREAVLDQITPEGVSLQHSFNYQRMVLHLLLWTLRLADLHHAQLDDSIRQRTQAAFDFMRAWVDPGSGRAPNYGSNDGSLILPLAPGEYGDFRPLLQMGASILDRPSLPPGPWDEAALWFSGNLRAAATKVRAAAPAVGAGYHRLGNGDSWALVRAGRYTRRPFQADQLHVDLWWRGINLARDAGTYLYNGDPPWNNGMSRTAVHNTVTVDRRDQMRRAGRFLWVDWAQASGRSHSSREHCRPDSFEGEHDGYRRIGVKHRRAVQWLPDGGWVIVDDLLGTGEHEARLHWLAADLPFEVSEMPFQVTFASNYAPIRWGIFASAPGEAAIIRGGKTSAPEVAAADTALLGWESPTYGELRPAVSLVYRANTRLPLRFVTVVLTDEKYRLNQEHGQLVIYASEAEVFRTGLAAETKYAAKRREADAKAPTS
ncbi:MAG: alginate lyase family protein [Candidatus Sulfotelmatobacter sp.]